MTRSQRVASAQRNSEPTVAYLLFSAYREMETRIFTALTHAGYGDVTPAQARLFRSIRPEGTRLTDIAQAANISKQTAGFLVDQLVRSGYVTRLADPADARARLVKIAPKGAAAIPIATAVVAKVEAEWAAQLGADRMRSLRDALQTLWQTAESFR